MDARPVRFCRRARRAILGAALAALVLPVPAQPDAQIACILSGCAQPVGDPLQRQGFGLRLAKVQHLGGATSRLPGGAPAAPSGPASLSLGDERFRDNPLALIDIANGHLLQGRVDQARQRLGEAQALLAAKPDRQAEAALQTALGAAAALQGRYPEARTQFERALQLYAALLSAPVAPPGGPSAADLMAQARRFAGVPLDPQAAQAAAAQLAGVANVMEQQFATLGVLRTRLNLANLAGQLGQYAEAERLLQQALDELPAQERATHERTLLAEFTVLYRRAGRADQAAAFERRAVGAGALKPSGGDAGLVALGDAASSGAPTEARAEAERLRPSQYAEAGHARLTAEAQERERAGDLPAALAAYSRIAMLAAAMSNPEREQAALAHLERLLVAGGGPAESAVFFGKRAVNASQQLRTELNGLERAARQAYLADKKRSYATLAALLLQQDRLAEAELVLRLLKEDEGQQLRSTAARAPRGRVPFSGTEAAWLAKYEAIAQRTRALEAERTRMLAQTAFGGALDAREQQERFWRQQIDFVDGMAAQVDRQIADASRKWEPVRAIAAKPPGARSTGERQELAKARTGRRVLLGYLEAQGAGLRALRRDGSAFVVPLSAGERGRIDAALARLASTHGRLEQASAFLGAEPDAAPADVSREVEVLLQLSGSSFGRYWIIDRELEQLDTERAELDAGLAAALAAARPITERSFGAPDAALLDTGPKLLATLPRGAVAVYYLAGDTQLDILLVRRDGRQAFRVPLARSALDEQVRAFRAALQDPRADAVAPARALYDALVAPLEPALQAAQAGMLMLALDGQLRYLPFAALHDGRGWLAERYAIGLYTTAAPAALAAVPAPRWRAAAFGSSAGGAGLAPLPAVRSELEGVVVDPAAGGRGVLPGVIRLDKGFTAAALRNALGEKFNVVHIASHFAFHPGDPNESFLLLGDGARLTLAEMAAPEYRFDRVDLVTLSACDTAVSGSDAFGQEVEGLGTLLQGQGAAAVLATLWSVADASTAQFMRSLYTLREQRKLSRAQAVRDAQLAMIRGPGGEAAGAQRGATRLAADGAAPRAADPARPYAHPYYWAPFVLMGNWL